MTQDRGKGTGGTGREEERRGWPVVLCVCNFWQLCPLCHSDWPGAHGYEDGEGFSAYHTILTAVSTFTAQPMGSVLTVQPGGV